jgi:hypothetical protein
MPRVDARLEVEVELGEGPVHRVAGEAQTSPLPALPGGGDLDAEELLQDLGQGARHIWHQLAQEAGVASFHPHQLRHTLGTLLQERLGDARLPAETPGHSGLASISGYTKITEARRVLEEGGLYPGLLE